MENFFTFSFILFKKIFKFLKERPFSSFVLIFVLSINCLPLPDSNIDTFREYTPVEKTIPNHKVLLIASGDAFPTLFSAKKEKLDIVLHIKLMKIFPDWPARINYQKKQEEFYKSAIKKQTQLTRLRIKDTSGFYTKE